MERHIFRKTAVVLGSFLLFSIFLQLFNYYLDHSIDQLYSKKIERMYGNQTEYVLKKSAERGNLFIMGSSELSAPVDQNPIYMYPNSKLDTDVTIDGRAYVQSLLQAMNIASLDAEDSAGAKLVLIVSLQWFGGGGEIDMNGFASNFSQLQFMNIVFSKNISSKNKKYICGRVLELLKPVEGSEDMKLLAALEMSDNGFVKAGGILFRPYYLVKYYILKIRDKYNTYLTLKSIGKEYDERYDSGSGAVDWEAAAEKAGEEGKAVCTNNEFFVEDEYYTTYLKDKISELRNSSVETTLNSKEREDFKCFLSVCRDLGIKPYIVMMNTNGYYYDYIGIGRDKRNELYQWVMDQSKMEGYECLIMPEMEYEPYFMRDVMHLGWKGWLYVNQKISEYYSQN